VSVLVLTERDVEELVDVDELREAVAEALADLSSGRASMPSRIAALVPEREALLGAMPAYLPSAGALTVKLVTLFPRNTDRPTHQAAILVFDAETGTPLALMDGTHVTATRTAAASAVATSYLARPDARVLALLGTGVQARTHARALQRVRRIDEIRVAGRSRERAAALAAELGAIARVAGSYEEALAGADVVAATTHATEPVVRREWLEPGTHVNSVGLNPAGREVDEATVADAILVVESRESALAPPPAGAPELAGIDPARVHAELGELVAGTRPGRVSAEEITLYKSVGVAVEDAAAAALVLSRARERGRGSTVEL
jgi:ornithine cyclodeaminase